MSFHRPLVSKTSHIFQILLPDKCLLIDVKLCKMNDLRNADIDLYQLSFYLEGYFWI